MLVTILIMGCLMNGHVSGMTAAEYCDGKPLGKYCLADSSGYFACSVNKFTDLESYFSNCPIRTRCQCPSETPCQLEDDPCVLLDNPTRPSFAKLFFGTMAITESMCDKSSCTTKITVSEKYQENDKSREELIQDLTEKLTVLVLPTGPNKWAQYFIDHVNGPLCEKRELPVFPGVTRVPENFNYNGEVTILGFPCQDWVFALGDNTTKRDDFSDHLFHHTMKRMTPIYARKSLTRGLFSSKLDSRTKIQAEEHIYVAKLRKKFFPLKVQRKQHFTDSNVTVYYNEVMTQYFAEKRIQLPDLFKLPPVCNQTMQNTPVSRPHHHHKKIFSDKNHHERIFSHKKKVASHLHSPDRKGKNEDIKINIL